MLHDNQFLKKVQRQGMTLIELLIVVSIIGMLISLVLPAVQASREASRKATCVNNLRQVGMAMHLHQSQQKTLPTNGWGYQWVGDPDRGFGKDQPGGWIFNVLPFLEQDSVRSIARNLPENSPDKKSAIAQMLQTPIMGLNCPSRRGSELLPTGDMFVPFNSNGILVAARSDYAANGGDIYCDAKGGMTKGPSTLVEAKTDRWLAEFRRLEHDCNGIVFPQSLVSFKDISDGTSHTYMIGEKYIHPDHYLDGGNEGDERSLCIGANREINRWAFDIPRHDFTEEQGSSSWGGPHPGGFHMIFCDGSTQVIDYDIDIETHKRQSNRRDDLAQ
jgi:prepilin-type N-terminal cleavage/methylation domain-containing protein